VTSSDLKSSFQESAEFVSTVKRIFSTSPYATDPRKEMIQRHLINGVAASASRIRLVLPYLKKDLGNLRILDVGCGSGMGSAAFSRLGVREIIGFDPGRDTLGLNLARLRTYGSQASVSLVQASGYHIPLAGESVDLCWCSFVVEHVPQPGRLFRELYRVLVPSGVVYISTNNRLWPVEPHSGTLWTSWLPVPLAEKYARWRQRWPEWESWHVYPPTYWQLHRWAADAGFRVVASTYQLVSERFRKHLQKLPWLSTFEAFFPNLYLLSRKM
jgi:ubiquinone/menaquinone biosynthesis C-methylase UbiE